MTFQIPSFAAVQAAEGGAWTEWAVRLLESGVLSRRQPVLWADSQPVLADSVHSAASCSPERSAGPPANLALPACLTPVSVPVCSAAGARCTHTENQAVSASQCPTFWQSPLL